MKQTETSLKATLQDSKAPTGELKIIRPSSLAETGVTGVVAEGVLEKVVPNKFNAAQNDYFIRAANGDLYILNETRAIREQLDQLEGRTGVKIKVVYNGKIKTKNGKGFHDFEIFQVA